ncbi:aromatic acid exporter family protein [Staphylococcus sp. SQ8-PEA]|uniref:Aromatic acid exporter family protein n=1 Tax=Staphylococcus marylandisciuri TaxID=2981529 RepID=A0ABT2QQR9_9STAP|nr:aromatic acid exporter family protein [Staphylococcus marylandisciuri]MCU5746335.1 aromatic acid exporter family protein [Staphylococcus marylandisciuri]
MLSLNPYRIGFRTIKTAIGMALGIIIAKWLGLDNFASSAILVVLCIKHTKIHSVQAIFSRFVSCLMILLIGMSAFGLLGQHALVVGLIVLLFIPLTVVFKVQEGVITSCVILLHVFNAKTIDIHLFINEILLLCVGLGIAFLMNLIMPSMDAGLNKYKVDVEDRFAQIFEGFSSQLKERDRSKYIDKQIEQLQLVIKKAKSFAFRDVKNHFVRNENSYYHYFDMREEQLDLLKRIFNLLDHIVTRDDSLEELSELMAEIALNVNSNDYTALRLHSLYQIRLHIKSADLPTTHDELETRASIMQILYELEAYLNIKSQFGSLRMHNDVKNS